MIDGQVYMYFRTSFKLMLDLFRMIEDISILLTIFILSLFFQPYNILDSHFKSTSKFQNQSNKNAIKMLAN
jgi:hypothetical protein